jgi:hypothetical protein
MQNKTLLPGLFDRLSGALINRTRERRRATMLLKEALLLEFEYSISNDRFMMDGHGENRELLL